MILFIVQLCIFLYTSVVPLSFLFRSFLSIRSRITDRSAWVRNDFTSWSSGFFPSMSGHTPLSLSWMAIHCRTEGRTAANKWNCQPQILWAAKHLASKPKMKDRALKQTSIRVTEASTVPQWSGRSPNQPRKSKETRGIFCHKLWGLM
jgi:hypothetical protein